MYKPPENCNRVKSIRSKFENGESNNNNNSSGAPEGTKNGKSETEIAVDRSKAILARQLSDPAKRNIKRTPAFRIDRNADKVAAFQRSAPHSRSYYFENKVKQYSSALKNNNCDRNVAGNGGTERIECGEKAAFPKEDVKVLRNSKPALIKSKSSHDFAYIRSKFDNNKPESSTSSNNPKSNDKPVSSVKPKSTNDEIVESQRKDSTKPGPDLALLYTEPIPKSLRNKLCDTHIYSNIENVDPVVNIYTANTLKVADPKPDEQTGLTDTLKTALKRPLPPGPAPKKPPRTFEHASPGKNESFLHLKKDLEKVLTAKPATKSKDPRYMLTKLEHALRNNKIKGRTREAKPEISTTSGEDSDDSLLFRSKLKKDFPTLPDPPTGDSSPNACPNSFNFNCLNGLTFSKSSYERIKEPNSEFFVSCEEEPVYAEPFHLPEEEVNKRELVGEYIKAVNRNVRNSLYYMSTPVLCDEDKDSQSLGQNPGKHACGETPLNQKQLKMAHRQVDASEVSSLSSSSSFNTDPDSLLSTPQEETKSLESAIKIKLLIDVFETKPPSTATLPRTAAKVEEQSKNRVDTLKMSIQKTLDRCFAHDASLKDSNSDSEEKERKVSVDKMISKFQTYVKTMPKYRRAKLNLDDRLFYCCLIVGWDNRMPRIMFKFPHNVEVPPKIEDLCYPEAASGPLDRTDNAQCYSLVITNDRGERTFGYCRRVMPEGSTNCLPLAYCILSKHRAPRFYKKILTELESRHGIPDKLRDELINEFYRNKFPRFGESIRVDLTNIIDELNEIKSHQRFNNDRRKYREEVVDSLDLTSFVHVNKTGEYGTLNKVKKKGAEGQESIFVSDHDVKSFCNSPSIISESGGKTELILTLHHDARYEDADLKPLHRLPGHVLLKVFASLLLERKVILISCVISKLSCCVDALQSILYPFSWPHTFIPILPQCLWDVVESPTPVVCGILSVAVVNEYRIEHGIVVDLDEGDILSQEGDEDSILSNSMKKAWEQGIALANTVPPEDYVHSVYLSDAYMKVFIACLKNYKNFIVEGNFQKEAFIRNGKTKGIRRFLKWFTETSLFSSFIETVISNPQGFTLFDKKMEIYGSDDSNIILSKLLEWKK